MSGYNEQPMTTGEWFWTMLIMAVPVLNVIMFIVWALGSGNRNRVTWCRASLLWTVIGIVFYIILITVGLGTGTLWNQT